MGVRSQRRTTRFLAIVIFTALLPVSPATAQDPLDTPLD